MNTGTSGDQIASILTKVMCQRHVEQCSGLPLCKYTSPSDEESNED